MNQAPQLQDTRTPSLAAAALAAVYGALTPLHLLLLNGSARVVMATLALCSALGLGAVAVRTWRRPTQPWWIGAILAVPVLNVVVHLGVTRDAGQTSVVMLGILGVGGLVSSRRSAVALVAALCAGWAAVAAGGFDGRPVAPLAVQVAMSCVGAALLHETRRRHERRLHAASAVLADALHRSETDRGTADEAGRRFRLLFSASPVGIGLADENGHFVMANAALCELFGRTETELLGGSSLRFTHPADQPAHGSARQLMADSDLGVLRVEKRYLRPDGEIRWAWLTITATPGPQGQAWTLAHVQDVTDRHESEQRLADSEANLAAVSKVVRQIRTGQDSRSSIVAAVLDLAGARSAVLVERVGDESAVSAAVGSSCDASWSSVSQQVFGDGQPAHASGPEGYVRCQPVVTTAGVVAVLVAVWDGAAASLPERAMRALELLADEAAVALEHDALLEQLGRQAVTDPLTGLPNRRAWDTALADALGQVVGAGRLHVALLDLDHFKRFNDAYGHGAGDGLLQELASTCRMALRDGDVLARWGGEEFAVLLPDCSAVDAQTVLERLRAAVPQGQTASVGVATWDGLEPPRQLLARADRAMYEAKRLGRNRLAVDGHLPEQRRAADLEGLRLLRLAADPGAGS